MTVLEIIKRHQPVTASEIAHHLHQPVESIYPELVKLDACDKVRILCESSGNGDRQWISRRAYTPKHNGLRARMLRWWAENPGKPIARAKIPERFGVAERSIQEAVTRLRRDGLIKTTYGPNRTTFYTLQSLPLAELPTLPAKPKPIRDWPTSSNYVPPRPIVTSIFDLARHL